jgi:hypothetical protein
MGQARSFVPGTRLGSSAVVASLLILAAIGKLVVALGGKSSAHVDDILQSIAHWFGSSGSSLRVAAAVADVSLAVCVLLGRTRQLALVLATVVALAGAIVDMVLNYGTSIRGCGCFGPPEIATSAITTWLRLAIVTFAIASMDAIPSRLFSGRRARLGMQVVGWLSLIVAAFLLTLGPGDHRPTKRGGRQDLAKPTTLPSSTSPGVAKVRAVPFAAESRVAGLRIRFQILGSGEIVSPATITAELCTTGAVLDVVDLQCDEFGECEYSCTDEQRVQMHAVRVVARCEGRADTFREFGVPSGVHDLTCAIEMKQKSSVSLRSVFVDGSPIEGATVTLFPEITSVFDPSAASNVPADSPVMKRWLTWPTGTTDVNGRIGFSIAPGEYRAVVQKRG